MSGDLGSLNVKVSADIAQFEAGLNKADYLAKKNAESIVRSINHIENSVKNMLASLVPTIGAAMFVEMIKGSIETVSHLNDLSAATSISVGKLAGLQLASSQVGSNLDTTARAIDFLSKNIGKNADAYKSIGISAKDPLEAFKQLADLFVSIQDPQERAAVMAKALGKSWQEAAPLLAMGGQRLGENVDQGEKLSGVTDANAASFKEFNDSLKTLETASGGVVTRLSVDLIPLMQVMTGTMLDAETKTADLANAFNPLTETLRGLLIIGNRFYDTFAQIGIVLAATTAQMVALANGNLSGYSAIQDQAKADLAAMDARAEALQEHLLDANTNAVSAAKKVAADKLQIQNEYQADSLTVMQFYLDKSVAVQQKAQWDLAKAFGMPTAGLPNQTAIDKFKASRTVKDTMDKFKASRTVKDTMDTSGMQLLIGLENTYQNELAKRQDLMNAPGMSASEKALADALRTSGEQAQKVRIELEKIKEVNLAKVADATGMSDTAKLTASANVVAEYDKNLAQVNKDLDKQTIALRAQAAQIDKNNASWQYGATVALRTYLDEVQNVAKSTEALMTRAFKGMEDALVNFCMTGKLDFSSLANSIIADLLRIQIQKSITGPLAGMMGSMFAGAGGGAVPAGAPTGGFAAGSMPAANGAWFDNGAAHFASGGIFDSPTQFKFANGGGFNNGVMGEAGPEAVMPLTRGKDGKLGIVAQGSSGTVIHLTYAPVNHIDARSDIGQVRQIADESAKRGSALLVDKLQRQGVL